MTYIHAIDLDNFYPCWNLKIDGKLRTPNYLAAIDPGLAKNHRNIDSYTIDELREYGPQDCGLTPRTIHSILKAAILRKGHKIVDGYDREILVSEESRNSIIEQADIELNFERVRRKYPNQQVSRLSCIWLAEHSEAGREHIKNMLGKDIYILSVRISNQLSLSKVDTAWFDAYCESHNSDFIDGYWSGASFSEHPKWEYLLDGEIEIENPDQLAYIKSNGASLLGQS